VQTTLLPRRLDHVAEQGRRGRAGLAQKDDVVLAARPRHSREPGVDDRLVGHALGRQD
jgi:hypothetical protein